MSITAHPFGSENGSAVQIYTLSNGHMTVNITNFGGVVQSIYVPDRSGAMANVALGFKELGGYLANDVDPQPAGGSGSTYFGAIIGRYANRIAHGEFTLDGATHHVPRNNGMNALHGGPSSWNAKVWTATPITEPGSVSLQLTYTSPEGENGFPGTVIATVTYTLGDTNVLRIDYHATTDRPTVINMTNHTYFNLHGEGSGTVNDQKLMINADRYTPIDADLIPTGAIVPVAGTPLDFRTMKPVGRDINSGFGQLVLAHGYDHNFVLNRTGPELALAARAEDPLSGRVLTEYTTEPGLQFYSGNFLAGELVGTSGRTYRQTEGFALESQHYPNSPNQPNFPSTVLNPGQEFNSTTVYAFSTSGT